MSRSITDVLKQAIVKSGQTHYRLAQQGGIRPQVIDYFMRGERSLKLETADKLASVLGLQMTELR